MSPVLQTSRHIEKVILSAFLSTSGWCSVLQSRDIFWPGPVWRLGSSLDEKNKFLTIFSSFVPTLNKDKFKKKYRYLKINEFFYFGGWVADKNIWKPTFNVSRSRRKKTPESVKNGPAPQQWWWWDFEILQPAAYNEINFLHFRSATTAAAKCFW